MSKTARIAYLVNPLPSTLNHYEEAMRVLLAEAGVTTEVVPCPSVEVGSSGKSKVTLAIASAWSRAKLLARPKGVVIGLWPALGLFECLLYLPASVRHEVLLIVHDPIPIRAQFGYSRVAKLVARLCTHLSPQLRLVTHTEIAAIDLHDSFGCQSLRLPHPLAQVIKANELPLRNADRVVRVLGQYKPTRSLEPLLVLGREQWAGIRFEILGRGWPQVEGWSVVDDFLEEDEFDRRIRTASCVVIPYARFYQSGVAARCAELGVPIAGPRHEHLEELYGRDWPGLVSEDDDWSNAVMAALKSDRHDITRDMTQRRSELHGQWLTLLRGLLRP